MVVDKDKSQSPEMLDDDTGVGPGVTERHIPEKRGLQIKSGGLLLVGVLIAVAVLICVIKINSVRVDFSDISMYDAGRIVDNRNSKGEPISDEDFDELRGSAIYRATEGGWNCGAPVHCDYDRGEIITNDGEYILWRRGVERRVEVIGKISEDEVVELQTLAELVSDNMIVECMSTWGRSGDKNDPGCLGKTGGVGICDGGSRSREVNNGKEWVILYLYRDCSMSASVNVSDEADKIEGLVEQYSRRFGG